MSILAFPWMILVSYKSVQFLQEPSFKLKCYIIFMSCVIIYADDSFYAIGGFCLVLYLFDRSSLADTLFVV